MNHKEAFEINKNTWNSRVDIHAKSAFYDMEAFRKGATSLNKFELDSIGNVTGKSLLHLQCHFGQDTLSWSRMGAKCVGVDLSDKAVELATNLSKELELDAQFVCCNVLDTSSHVTQLFDWVFTSYGTIGWLPDLKPWGKMIAERLAPGGSFYIIDFHPIAWMFDYSVSPPVLVYNYQQDEAIYEEYEGTYADPDSKIESKEYGWNHSLGEVINVLTEAGLRIEFLNEIDESPYDVFPSLIKNEAGNYQHEKPLFPLMFELKATKPLV